MPMTDEQRIAKLKEIVKLRDSGKYKNFEEASIAAGMGKMWYFKNKSKLPNDTNSNNENDTVSIKEIPGEPITFNVIPIESKSIKESKSNKRTHRVLLTLSEKRYQYFKAKADNRDMDLSQLLAYAIGEAQDNDLV